MFDFSMSELLVIAVVVLIAIGPGDLPRALHTMGRWMGKARAMAREFHRHVDEMVRETELEDFHRKAKELNRKSLAQVLEDVADPEGEVRRGLELPELSESTTTTTPHGSLVGSGQEDGEGLRLPSGGSSGGRAAIPLEPTDRFSAPLPPP